MTCKLTALLVIVAAHSASVSAQDLTVTFEPAALPGGSKIIPEWIEDGLRFTTPDGVVSNDIADDLFPFGGTPYLQTLFGQSPLTITSAALQPFSFFSVDLAEYSTLFAAPKSITFLGMQVGGNTVSVTFMTDGVIDGDGPRADFQTFFFPASFTDLTQVSVSTDTYSMDNLVAVVPEPAAGSLLLATIIFGGAWRRLKQRAARL